MSTRGRRASLSRVTMHTSRPCPLCLPQPGAQHGGGGQGEGGSPDAHSSYSCCTLFAPLPSLHALRARWRGTLVAAKVLKPKEASKTAGQSFARLLVESSMEDFAGVATLKDEALRQKHREAEDRERQAALADLKVKWSVWALV